MIQNTDLKSFDLPHVNHYKVYGRTDLEAYPLPLFWNGSAIEVNVTGTELWIDIEVDFDAFEPWIGVAIDGAFINRQMLLPGSYSVCLFRNMPKETVKNVCFFRELQAMSDDSGCHLLIRGFQSDGEFLPVPEKELKLEFIGDSITSGEGTYGPNGDQPWISMFMSASRNYATLTAKALNADCHLLSQGGWGVLCGWDNNPYHNLPSCYEKICGLAGGETNRSLGAQKPNPFDSWQPDAIVVNLGTNDCSAFSQPEWLNSETGETFGLHKDENGAFCPKDIARFQKAVIDFLYMLRKHNPTAKIVWVYGMLGHDLSCYIKDAVEAFRGETSDCDVTFLELPDTAEKDIGCRFHPGVHAHEKAAEILSEYLREVLNR